MPSPQLPQRIPEDLGIPESFAPLSIDVVSAVAEGLRAWARGAADTYSRGVDTDTGDQR
jgi:hypothetical protein